MSKRPEPSPEGQLITAALKRSRLSAREAARRAELSEVRWRQIASGFQTVSGQQIPVRGPADTVARMAKAVGLLPQQLAEVGRGDAADELKALLGETAGPEESSPGDDFEERIARIRANPEARKRLVDLLTAGLLRQEEEQAGEGDRGDGRERPRRDTG
jgi:hypothetical protein